MQLLEGRLQYYDWGSHSAIADLGGRPPSGRPEAELWYGIHPSGPSLLAEDTTTSLADLLAGLGEAMPYLVKILAADRPLSLQVHPDAVHAAAGFAAEEAAGVEPDAPHRAFLDDRPKPELVCALSHFEALCGFRPVAEARAVAHGLGLPTRVSAALDDHGLAAAVDAAFASPDPSDFVDRCRRTTDGPWSAEASLVVRLADIHPGDPALALVPLLCHRHLSPGEALFLGPGVVHAYLGGLAVEVMSSTDNVVRGGFTTKPVDPATFRAVADVSATASVQRPDGARHRYDVPVAEFCVERLVGTSADMAVRAGPDVVGGTAGTTDVTAAGRHLVLPAGAAACVPAADGPYRVDTDGVAFTVSVGSGTGA